MTWSILTNKFM